MTIHAAAWRDCLAVLRLEKLCFGRDAWPGPDVFAVLVWPDVVRLKAEVEGALVGFVAADRRTGEGFSWIATIGVHPEFRRRGIGERLLRECERRLKAGQIRLTVRAGNLPAIQLYRKSGYCQIGVWRQYYRGGEDGVVMEKRVSARHFGVYRKSVGRSRSQRRPRRNGARKTRRGRRQSGDDPDWHPVTDSFAVHPAL